MAKTKKLEEIEAEKEPNKEDVQRQQEMMFKLQMFEQQAQQIQQQLQAVEQGMVELNELSLGLEEMKGKKGSEIMAPIGRGIFARAKLLSEDLTVDVGGKNLVKKSIDDTRELIGEQVKKLEQVKEDLNKNLEELNKELMGVVNVGK